MEKELEKLYQSLKIDTRKKASPAEQISNQIQLLIRDKHLNAGDFLPSPMALSKTLNIDASIVQTAYQHLIDSVFVTVKNGAYEVVRLQMMEGFLRGFYSVFETFERHGFTPASEEIDASVVEKLPAQFSDIEARVKGPYIFQRRLYRVNGNPLFLVDFYNLPKYFEGHSLPLKDIDFLTYFKKELDHPMVHFSREVIAIKPTKEEAKHLNIPNQHAILGAKLINYDADHEPLNFSLWRGSLKFSFWLKTAIKN